jgi:hypothetical protein
MAWLPTYGTFTTRQQFYNGHVFYVVKAQDERPAPATYVYVDERNAERKAASLRAQGYVQVSGR